MHKRSAGFTLIELMIAVTIIGMLATVALPAFQKYQLRSRIAERDLFSAQIHRAAAAYLVQHAQFPRDLGGGLSSIFCGPNPPAPPGTGKHLFVLTLDDWNLLGAMPEGSLHFQYRLVGTTLGALRSHTVRVTGDLDGDGLHSELQRQFDESAGITAVTENIWGGPY
jgi:prepilin-type N-terminal cleavage/methylation domain-containing protein